MLVCAIASLCCGAARGQRCSLLPQCGRWDEAEVVSRGGKYIYPLALAYGSWSAHRVSCLICTTWSIHFTPVLQILSPHHTHFWLYTPSNTHFTSSFLFLSPLFSPGLSHSPSALFFFTFLLFLSVRITAPWCPDWLIFFFQVYRGKNYGILYWI